MIPKVIHYCWFGGGAMPRSLRACLRSWHRHMPDFALKRWDESNFDISGTPFAQEAYRAKKYAFVADVARLYALFHEGGIYLDTDVEALRSLSDMLRHNFLTGTEAYLANGEPHYRMEASLLAATPRHPFVEACLRHYQASHFTDETVIQERITRVAEAGWGYRRENVFQGLRDGMAIYPTAYYTNTLVPDTARHDLLHAVHHNAASWMDFPHRGTLFHFCRRHDLMGLYRALERLRPQKQRQA